MLSLTCELIKKVWEVDPMCDLGRETGRWVLACDSCIFVDSMRGMRLISHMLVKRKFLFLNQTECEPSAGPNLKSFGDASRSRTGRQDVVLSGEKK